MTTPACPYCGDPTTPRCFACLAHLGREYRCTRPAPHEGPHVACTLDRHQVRTWHPTTEDAAQGLFEHYTALRAATRRTREHLQQWTQLPHDEHCDGDNPCPRDVAEEALALLRAPGTA